MNKQQDFFANIAENFSATREGLIEPQPPILPNKQLESDKHSPSTEFKRASKIDTPEKLFRELQKQRKTHEKFLKDYSPEIRRTRKTIALKQFDWRLATERDFQDFGQVLNGKGKWKQVEIPHYGGPLGKATTYYRTTFNLPASMLKIDSLFACFKGVDYKAKVFVNGSYVGSNEGFFAPFEFDFTRHARPGKNTLVVTVENDAICMGNRAWNGNNELYEGDKIYAATGPGYDDPQIGWHHCPPGMGIYQDVCIESRNKLHVHDIFVRPDIDNNRAEAWIEVFNTSNLKHDISLKLSVFGQNFHKTVFKDQKHNVQYAGPGVNYYRIPFDIPNAKLWDNQTPWLYKIHVDVLDTDSNLCDTRCRQFGMRKFVMDEECEPKGFFYLNNRPIRLRGANTMGHLQQCVMKNDFEQLKDDILLAKICNMNFLRLTQRPVQQEIYEYCDRLGLMVQTDLPMFCVLRRNQYCEAIRQSREMEKLIRSHPSNIMVSYFNEPSPDAWGKPQRHLLRNELQDFFESADKVIHHLNPERVIKHVDGDYDPPCDFLPDNHCYNTWYNGHGLDLGKLIKGYWQQLKSGWNYGCGEFGTEGLDYFELMNERYPESWLPENRNPDIPWTPEKIVRSQTQNFHYMWYPSGNTQREWVNRSQKFQAWAMQTMTEAFRRDNKMVTFAIHLFIDAFPSGWMKAIMDCRRTPKPAFFAYMNALSPLAINLRSDRFSYSSGEKTEFEVWICNDRDTKPDNCELRYQIRDSKRNVIFAQRSKAKIEICNPTFQGFINWQVPVSNEKTTYSLEAAIVDKQTGKALHDTSQEIHAFPQEQLLGGTKFYVLGTKENRAWNLIKQLGGRPVKWTGQCNGTIVCDSLTLAQKHKKSLEKALTENCRVVFTELDEKELTSLSNDPEKQTISLNLGGLNFSIEPASMSPRHFANCNTNHPLVQDFEDNDFFCWYNDHEKMITPFLSVLILSQDLTPVLTSGQGGWSNPEWQKVIACGAKNNLIVSALSLNHRIQKNPVAMKFAKKLLLKPLDE